MKAPAGAPFTLPHSSFLIHHSASLPPPSSSRLDPKPVHSGPDLIAGGHFGVLGWEGIEERAVPAAEVADADGAFGIGDDFEVLARQELVGDAHVALAADDEAGRRDLELLPLQ